MVCRPSVRPSLVHHFQRASSPKPFGLPKPDLLWSLSGMGEQKFVRRVWVTWPRWPPCPLMVKPLQKSSSPEPKGQWPCGLVSSTGYSGPIIVYSNDDPRLTLIYFQQGQIWSLMLLYGEKLLENHLMEETYNKWPKWQKVYVKIKILTPGCCLPLPRGYIHV